MGMSTLQPSLRLKSASPERDPPYVRYRILALAALTNILVVAAPSMCLPVLFEEIAAELHLNLVEVGAVWGISALPGAFMGLVGGALGDRIGPKRVLIVACLLAGVFGVLRSLANSFWTLSAAMVLLGLVLPLIPLNTLKACGMVFPRRQLGLASGILSMGMALGFLIGSMLSATVLSPWLGGWRQVLFLYAGISFLIGFPWAFGMSALPSTVPRRLPSVSPSRSPERADLSLREVAVEAPPLSKPASLLQTVGTIVRIRNIWLLGLAFLGISGCIQGALGYLPLYLRGLGWPPASADGALASFHAISMIFVIPIALASDKLGTRKKVLLAATVLAALGFGLLSVAEGWLIWVAVLMAGIVRDGFMAVMMTFIIETEGVGAAFAGTAAGVVMFFGGLGNLLAPPLGNSLAGTSPSLPFVFWAALTAAALVALLAVREARS